MMVSRRQPVSCSSEARKDGVRGLTSTWLSGVRSPGVEYQTGAKQPNLVVLSCCYQVAVHLRLTRSSATLTFYNSSCRICGADDMEAKYTLACRYGSRAVVIKGSGMFGKVGLGLRTSI